MTISDILMILNFIGWGGMAFYMNKSVSEILKKKPEITFGYYSKLKMYLIEFEVTLGDINNTPLEVTLVDFDEVDYISVSKMQDVAEKILSFFSEQEWQIPIDQEFDILIQEFLKKIIRLVGGNLCKYNTNREDLKNDYNEIISLIDCIIIKINNQQNLLVSKAENSQKALKKDKKLVSSKMKK